jgi:hypothetical protein
MSFSFPLFRKLRADESGINMVDLMMWLVIASLLLATALQGIGYYQQTSFSYQAKTDLASANTWTAARTSIDASVPSSSAMAAAITSGELRLTKVGETANIGMIAVSDTGYCVGIEAPNVRGPNNVFYSSSSDPSTVIQASTIPTSCGVVTILNPPPATEVPGTPVVVATVESPTVVKFAWAAVPHATSYKVESKVNTASWNVVSPSQTALTSTVTTDPGDTVAARVTAMNSLGSSPVSNVASAALAPSFATLTWTNRSASMPTGLRMLTSSSDGMKLLAAGNTSAQAVYLSTDGGETWTSRAIPDSGWIKATSSADGNNLMIINSTKIYASSDSGQTWSTKAFPASGGSFASIAGSKDGTKIYISKHGGASTVWASTDSGTTWTQKSTVAGGIALATSADGTIVIGNGRVSKDSGATWTTTAASGAGNENVVALSTDGTKVLSGKLLGNLMTSTNSAASWTVHSGLGGASTIWDSVAISADGTKMVAGQRSNGYGYVWTSIDSGATWKQETDLGTGSWGAVSLSADGSMITVASSSPVKVYTGRYGQ